MKNALAMVALASCISAICRAESPPPAVPENLLACGKLEDAGQRVHCYDEQIAAMKAASATSGRAAAAVKSSSSANSAAQFGQETLPPTSRPAPKQTELALHSSITALSAVGPKTYAISLSNGQVWRQVEESHIAQFFRVGDDVQIEKAALGSYHMSTATTGSKNWVRVTRIQ